MTDQSRTPRTDELITEMAVDGLDMADRETCLQDFARALELEAADLAKAEQNPVFSSLDMLTRKTYGITASQQEPVAVHTRNLANDPLYKSLDALYRRGWTDRSKERDYDPRGTIQWQETLDLFRRYTAALEDKVEAERPEPVAWLVQYRDRHEFTFKKPAFLIDAIAEPLYGPDLLDHADRMESAYKMAHQQAMENGEKRLVAERQLAELQAKHDALVKALFLCENALCQQGLQGTYPEIIAKARAAAIERMELP